jgi:N-acetylneuraminic acid mutarotase
MVSLDSKVVLADEFYDSMGHIALELFAFDGTSWAALSMSGGPLPRAGAAIATLGGRLVLFGGIDLVALRMLNDTWVLGAAGWKHLATPHSPSPRAGAAIAMVGDKLVLFGGNGTKELGDTWIFDGSDWSQASLATSPDARTNAVMVSYADNAFLLGGKHGPYDVWKFSGSSWTKVSNAPQVLFVAGGALPGLGDP